MNNEEDVIEYGSGNVFSDMGHSDAKEKLQKSRLISILDQYIKELRLTQVQASRILGIDQSNLSKILRGQLRLVTSDKLVSWIEKLGADVEIKVIFHPREKRGITVTWCPDEDCQAVA